MILNGIEAITLQIALKKGKSDRCAHIYIHVKHMRSAGTQITTSEMSDNAKEGFDDNFQIDFNINFRYIMAAVVSFKKCLNHFILYYPQSLLSYLKNLEQQFSNTMQTNTHFL